MSTTSDKKKIFVTRTFCLYDISVLRGLPCIKEETESDQKRNQKQTCSQYTHDRSLLILCELNFLGEIPELSFPADLRSFVVKTYR